MHRPDHRAAAELRQPPLDLPFARTVHDRAAHRRAQPGLVDGLRRASSSRVLRVWRDRVEVTSSSTPGSSGRLVLAPAGQVGDDGTWLFLGTHDDAALLAVVLAKDASADEAPDRAWTGLRELATLDDLEHGLAVEAVALAQWHRTHAHCPRCGAATTVENAGWTRRCTVESVDLYPRTDPAVIMAVVDDADRILLGHAAHWPEGRFSTLAGFVEPGEGLEQALRREVAEETGVVVGAAPEDVVYRGSQAWPFPGSLMVGFRARAVGTAIQVDDDEISAARWFTRAELLDAVEAGDVGLPGRQSIARALIEEWYGGRLPGQW